MKMKEIRDGDGGAAMTTRAAFSDLDLAALERAVKRFQALGLEASLNVINAAEGRATIWHVDPRHRLTSTCQFQIEKFERAPGRFEFVVGISRTDGQTWSLRDTGRVSANILHFALAKAEMAAGAVPGKQAS